MHSFVGARTRRQPSSMRLASLTSMLEGESMNDPVLSMPQGEMAQRCKTGKTHPYSTGRGDQMARKRETVFTDEDVGAWNGGHHP